MWNLRLPGWKPLAKWTAIVTAAAVAVLTVFILSGIYNVAASSDHFGVTNRVIKLVLRRSVATRSLFVGEPPDLADPDLIRLGAGHYGGGCQPCHGSPGEPANPIVTEMLPAPPSLPGRVDEWSDEEMFWIVENGLKFTGMPAWPAPERDDEIWAVVAFLKQLPGMTNQEYVQLARGNAAPEPVATTSDFASLTECARCHGTESAPPTSSLIPRLAGQSQAYLERALMEFSTGIRSSGIMHPVAFELDGDAIRDFASYFADMPAPPIQTGEEGAPRANLEQGRQIAEAGIRADRIPACLSCHSGRTGTFPRLAGQSADYLAGQLALWRKGLRETTRHGAIMAPIARRLSEQQGRDVAAYFESLVPATTTAPKTGGEAAR